MTLTSRLVSKMVADKVLIIGKCITCSENGIAKQSQGANRGIGLHLVKILTEQK